MNDKIIRTLIVELMGRYSNIMLVNDKLYIIDALKRHDLQDLSDTSRSIMPARKYIYPKNDKIDFLSLNLNDFLEISLNKDIHVIDTLISNTFIGISKLFVQSTVDKLKISNTVNKENLKEVYEYIYKILEYKTHIVITIKIVILCFYIKEMILPSIKKMIIIKRKIVYK